MRRAYTQKRTSIARTRHGLSGNCSGQLLLLVAAASNSCLCLFARVLAAVDGYWPWSMAGLEEHCGVQTVSSFRRAIREPFGRGVPIIARKGDHIIQARIFRPNRVREVQVVLLAALWFVFQPWVRVAVGAREYEHAACA